MRKQEFLDRLRSQLSGLPEAEINERLNFYSEMIDDRMEDGLSEEEAVAAVEISEQIVTDTQKMKPRRQLKTWEIVLLVLGAPVWLPLVISAVAVVFSLYISWWAAIVSLWAAFGAMAGTGVGGLISGLGTVFADGGLAGIALIGASIVCAGLSIFIFYGCKAATSGTLTLTKKAVLGVKKRLAGKEDTK